MTYNFGDSFDLYAAPADMVNGYWDSGSTANFQLGAGRFAGSQCVQWTNSAPNVVKSSGVNDAVHHFVASFKQTAAISGSNLAGYFELFDGATAQCSVVFRSDGAILLTSGGPAGTVLATYTGAFPVASTWYAFEIEVVINSTTGSFAVRKNGNTVNDFSATALNTRNSTNNYANKLQFGTNAATAQSVDDLFWQSGAATGAWLGDIRCYTRMPASDSSVQFSRNGGAANFGRVNEAQQDGLTTYVYDATPGHADFYGLAGTAGTPAVVIATTVRGYMTKLDVGTRVAEIQLRSGATTVATPPLALNASSWQWAYRTDVVDPNTGAAWAASSVNVALIGPTVTA